MFEFRLLGAVDLKGSDGQTVRSVLAQPKRVALLAYLAVATPNGFHRRDKLLGLFWPESDQERGRGALRKAVYLLRQSLGEEMIVSRGDEEIGLAEGALWCDAVAFEEALDADEPEQALELYRGDVLEGFFISEAPEFERWLEVERERLRGRAAEAAWTLAEREEADGSSVGAASWAKKAVSFSPDEEGGFRRLLELLDRVGDRAGAMKEYEAFARRLNEEYEGEPSPETQALIAAIRERDTADPGAMKAVERPAAEVPAELAGTPSPTAQRPAGLKGLISEVHRRSLWQVLLIYTGAALVAYQAVQALTEGLGLPDWFPGMAVVLFFVLLPVVLATAFVQEGGPPLTRQKPGPVLQAATPATAGAPRARGVLTWRNSTVGGVLAFVLLGVAVSGYMGMRVLGIGPWGTLIGKGVLEERDLIVLADFEDHTGDSILALTVTEGVRVRLEQSAVVRVAGDDHVGRVLQQMERDRNAPLTGDVAREVAIRAGLKAVVTGEVNPAGSGYLLSARLVAAETGETLGSFLETAADADAIIAGIDRLSEQLRERVGESLRAIRSSPGLGGAWTASLEAARLHTQAWRAQQHGDYGRMLDLVSRAIQIDTLFVQAYVARGAALFFLRRSRAQQIADYTRAYELRRRLPLLAQYRIEGRYYQTVTGEVEKRIEALRAVEQLDPNPRSSLNNLGYAYSALRDYARAEEMFRRNLERHPFSVSGRNLAGALFNQGKFDEAEEVLKRRGENVPGDVRIALYRATFASARGDYDAAEAHIRDWAEQLRDSPEDQAVFNRFMGSLAEVQGKLAEAESYFRAAVAIYEKLGLAAECLLGTVELAGLQLWFEGDTARALRTVAEAIERYPLDSIEPLERPNPELAGLYAFAGAPERARELMVEWETLVPPELRGRLEVDRRAAWGVLALAEGRAEDALDEYRFVQERIEWCPICGLPLLARAYELTGLPDSAVAMYETYVATPYAERIHDMDLLAGASPALGFDRYWLPVIYERLGDLYEQRGDTAKAIYYYGKLVNLWKDADPELQPRVEAARRAIEALSPDR